MGVDSEDFPLFSRNEPLHLLLDVLSVSDEEDESLSSKPRTRRENVSLVQSNAGSLLFGFAFASDRHTKSFAPSCNACSSS